MPRLWSETIEAHRAAVRTAALDTAATLVAEHGLRTLSMSRIAEQTGIGRATLYKYFADVEAILAAWHERQISRHLQRLDDARDGAIDPADRLRAVLHAFALVSRESGGHRDTELAALLHGDGHVAHAQARVTELFRDVLAEGVQRGLVRSDVPLDELATYCLHALMAAGQLASDASVARLVSVTLAGVGPGEPQPAVVDSPTLG